MGWESPSRWIIIAVVVLVLFGYKKLPDAARSVGRSLRIFKTEIKGMDADDKAREQASTNTVVTVPKAETVPTSSTPADEAPAAQDAGEARAPKPTAEA